MVDKALGRRIKENREKRGLTQEQLAERIDMSSNYYARMERGETYPRLETLIKIMNCLGVSADAVFRDVIDYSSDYVATELSKEIATLPPYEQKDILRVVELLIQQSKARIEREAV